jgi:hypothetical protein
LNTSCESTPADYAIDTSTIEIRNKRGLMDEKFLFRDNKTFNLQIGLA